MSLPSKTFGRGVSPLPKDSFWCGRLFTWKTKSSDRY